MDTQTTESPAGEVAETDNISRLDNFLDGDGIPEEEEEVEIEERTEEDESEESEEDEPEEEESTDSVEVDGKIIDLPPGTPAEVVEQVQAAIAEKEKALTADYTRKTQEAAEIRKFAEEQQKSVQQLAQFNQQHIQELAQYHALTDQLKQYDEVDWSALADADPMAYMKHRDQRAELRDSVNRMGQELGAKFQQAQAVETQRAQQVYKYTVDTLYEKIPNYGPETDKKLVNTAVEMGNRYGMKIDIAALQKMHDPFIWLGLHEISKLQDLMKNGAKDKIVQKKPGKFVKPGVKSNQTTESERRARETLKKTGKGAAALIEKFL